MAVARAIRDIVPVAGMGGEIEIYSPAKYQDPLGAGPLVGDKLEVGQWLLDHLFILADITHSGSNGAILCAKVAQDFNFHLEIPWNAMFRALRTGASFGFMEASEKYPFLAGTADNDYIASVKFNLGDPSQYAGEVRAYYYAPRVKLEKVRTICNSKGTEIVRMEVTGRGHGLLRGYHGDTLHFGGEVASGNPVPGLAGL